MAEKELSKAIKPVRKFRAGGCTATIWENALPTGGNVLNVQFKRTYKSGEDWKESDSFRTNDLPKLVIVAQQAYQFALENRSDKEA